MLVFLVGPTKASKDIATSNWTQVQTQAAKRTQVHAPGGNWTQAAKGMQGSQTDASADASSKSDASADATGRKQQDGRRRKAKGRGRKCGRKCRRKRTQVHATRRNWTQAAKQPQQDANAGASSKTDASEDASADTSSKTEARQAGALWLEGTHLIVVKGKKPAKRTDKGGGWLQCWFF